LFVLTNSIYTCNRHIIKKGEDKMGLMWIISGFIAMGFFVLLIHTIFTDKKKKRKSKKKGNIPKQDIWGDIP
jgi:RsiW-degrading membrane proteinase PrsW (M82 family)